MEIMNIIQWIVFAAIYTIIFFFIRHFSKPRKEGEDVIYSLNKVLYYFAISISALIFSFSLSYILIGKQIVSAAVVGVVCLFFILIFIISNRNYYLKIAKSADGKDLLIYSSFWGRKTEFRWTDIAMVKVTSFMARGERTLVIYLGNDKKIKFDSAWSGLDDFANRVMNNVSKDALKKSNLIVI